jgi:asparagine synthase (glutamine-hydrolysing)
MCGIAGKVFFDPAAQMEQGQIHAMLQPMRHRGPDGQGIYLDGSVGLGHLRLSIIDLGTGAQPMANEDQTVWIVFNGEIYNFQLLRKQLLARGHVFRSRSDTEVIIHAYEEFGPKCVEHLRGMFAFAIWDSKKRSLLLARDRLGIKPLYYCQTGEALWFASEMKGILADQNVPREVSNRVLRRFLAFNYAPGEDTLLQNVHRLAPGHYLVLENGKATVRQYWDLQFTRNRWDTSFETAAEELHDLLGSTVKDHMISDVPVGILLSGGVDSSAILDFATKATGNRLKTFTVGFEGGQVVDERPYARLAAERFGAKHYEISITADDFWNFLPGYVWHMEDPVCEPPAVALHYVSKLARDHVKVVLSGEGGDEAFAGYPNYPNMLFLDRIRSAAGPLARPVGLIAQIVGSAMGHPRLERYGYALGRGLADHYFSRSSGPTSFFNNQAKSFFSPSFLDRTDSSSAAAYMAGLLKSVTDEPLLNQMLYLDTKTWLPDDLLIKADKMTMANSIELRVPLLDHVVIEFAASLPAQFKVRGKETKRLLKTAFARSLPAEVIARKKAGFPVPYQSWLRNELRTRVEDLLLSSRATSRGYFRKEEVARLLRANAQTGKFSVEVFCLIVTELWHRKFIDEMPTNLGSAMGRNDRATSIPIVI